MPGDVVELLSLGVFKREKHLSEMTQSIAAPASGHGGWTRGLPGSPVKMQYSEMPKWREKM